VLDILNSPEKLSVVPSMTPKAPDAKPDAADQDTVTLDGLRDQFFVAHRACERFAKEVGAIAQKLQDAKADDPWLTEVRQQQAQPSHHSNCSVSASGGCLPPEKLLRMALHML